ncbi:co-chaperone GroES [bacterium]|nr:co-chaperone GroES [bacterium]MCK5598215.1 co-chaperone GroES [bacterium]
MKIKPLRDKVIIKPEEAKEQKVGALYIPDTAKEKRNIGVVIATGPGKRDNDGKLIKMDVKVKEHVIYSKYAGTEIEINNEKLIILDQDDIIGIIEK